MKAGGDGYTSIKDMDLVVLTTDTKLEDIELVVAYGAGGDYNKYKGVALVVMATNIKDMELVVITKDTKDTRHSRRPALYFSSISSLVNFKKKLTNVWVFIEVRNTIEIQQKLK